MNICFIGKINVGKSSLINKLVDQDVSIVSEEPGTTTDPVIKRYELIPVGPVTIFDTAGYDDDTPLGRKRIRASLKVIYRSDLAIVILDDKGFTDIDIFYIKKLEELKIPYILVQNKSDLCDIDKKTADFIEDRNINVIYCSMFDKNLDELKEEIVRQIFNLRVSENYIIRDLINEKDRIVLVIPIDMSAPKGRIILPQVQVLREILDANAIAGCCREDELQYVLDTLKEKPKMVVTDSQAIDFVSKTTPKDIKVTTFSTLFARYRGDLKVFLDGLTVLKEIKPTDKILIAEACSHHSMKDDIGAVKIPKWLNNYLGFTPEIKKVTGHDMPADLEDYKLVIHCGGCMMTRMEILRRINECQRRGVAITNYGLIISELHGHLPRVIEIFNKD
jgi:[FeFe] hydrogenase H-cluster maturation GTPase HydF